MKNHVFVSAIGTDSGKTLVSAILVKKWKADYWKPIQCGTPTDSKTIARFCGCQTQIFPETYLLKTPASPHFAASQEAAEIQLTDFKMPQTNSPLVVEGAGGLLVPINRKQTIADLIQFLKIPLVLVVNHYLGSLNHSLLTLQEIKRREIPFSGIVFNGEDFQDAESIILDKAQVPCLFRMDRWEAIDANSVENFCKTLSIGV